MVASPLLAYTNPTKPSGISTASPVPIKTVWIFSGFTYEEIMEGSRVSTSVAKEILALADVLVDGRFEKDKKNISLKFRGSENQRIIDLKQTFRCKAVSLWKE